MAAVFPSIKDVAKKARVSAGTVSNVFSGTRRVMPELAARVRAAATALGYEPDRAASQLRSGRAKIIAVLVPDLNNPFFTAIIASVESRLRHQGYEIIVASSNDDEALETSRLAAILAWRPAGLAVIPCSDAFVGRSLIERAKVPYVVADRIADHPAADTVAVDNREAGASGARHLLSLGHKRILVVASVMQLANIRERWAGALQVLKRKGHTAPDMLEAGPSFESAARVVSEWLDGNEQPSGILALTNFTTLGVLAALAERHITIPRQMSVIGFDDYAWMRARATPLTAISQPVDEIGRWICERLLARIGGDVSPPLRVDLACELVVRSSTATVHEAGMTSPASAKEKTLVRRGAKRRAG